MKPISIGFLCQTVKWYAVTFGDIKKDAQLGEFCDFGDSYGFLFEAEDKFANLYYCVEKETYKLYTYRPNMDIRRFANRKVLPLDIVEEKT